jgi:hypothetical protein
MMLEHALKALEAEQDYTAALKRVRGTPHSALSSSPQGQPVDDARGEVWSLLLPAHCC